MSEIKPEIPRKRKRGSSAEKELMFQVWREENAADEALWERPESWSRMQGHADS